MGSDPGIDALRLLASQVVLDRVEIDEVPKLAQDLLVEGLDTLSLRVLAVLLPNEREQIRPLFERVLSESGVEPPSAETASLLVADEIAAGIIDGKVSPSEGCRALERLCAQADYHDLLIPFILVEDFYSVVSAERALYEREVIAEARMYLERRHKEEPESEAGG